MNGIRQYLIVHQINKTALTTATCDVLNVYSEHKISYQQCTHITFEINNLTLSWKLLAINFLPECVCVCMSGARTPFICVLCWIHSSKYAMVQLLTCFMIAVMLFPYSYLTPLTQWMIFIHLQWYNCTLKSSEIRQFDNSSMDSNKVSKEML